MKTTKKHQLHKQCILLILCFVIGRKEIHKTSLNHQIVLESKKALPQKPKKQDSHIDGSMPKGCKRKFKELPIAQRSTNSLQQIVLANNPKYRDKNS